MFDGSTQSCGSIGWSGGAAPAPVAAASAARHATSAPTAERRIPFIAVRLPFIPASRRSGGLEGSGAGPLPSDVRLAEEHEVGGVQDRGAVVQLDLEPAARPVPRLDRLPAVGVVAGRDAEAQARSRPL